ncbi:MAG: DUF2612 domain-containing protein [Gallionella sp.]|nr:DUF2612 domain-containing protein [Gallionella sp.]MDD4958378.1 DUF2612 domain-containing protein [Gallionella sp.]
MSQSFTPTLAGYQALVPSPNQSKPDFMSMVSGLMAVALQGQATLLSMQNEAFDVDQAIGSQLDAVGLWVGITRNLNAPITNVYFSFDVAGLGFDQGVWYSPLDPTSGTVTLPDNVYRVLIEAKIEFNTWSGQNQDVSAILTVLTSTFPSTAIWQVDNQNLSVTTNFAVFSAVGAPPILVGLIDSGKFSVKPAGVAQIVHFWQYALLGYTETAPTPILSTGLGAFTFTSDTPGGDCYDGVDDGLYLWTEVVGNFEVSAKLSFQSSSTASKIGLAVRDTMLANGCVDIIAAIGLTNSGSSFYTVWSDFSATYPHTPDNTLTATTGSAGEYWVKITRVGGTVAFFYSIDGVNFAQLNSLTPPTLPSNLYVSACLMAASEVCAGTVSALRINP